MLPMHTDQGMENLPGVTFLKSDFPCTSRHLPTALQLEVESLKPLSFLVLGVGSSSLCPQLALMNILRSHHHNQFPEFSTKM